jgi:predicted ATPase/class 3 adenylate cyclase
VDGTVIFLLTDIEHSTILWDLDESEMRKCLARHDEIVGKGVERHGGRLIKARGEGDSHFVVFSSPLNAALAALEIQRQLQDDSWTTFQPIKVRMSIHLGESEDRDGDYYGGEVNRAARLRAIGHGGQVLVSSVVRELIHYRLPERCWLIDLGEHRLKDLLRAEHVYQLCAEGLALEFPPLNSLDKIQNNLPTQLTSFIGREDNIEQLRALLGKNRLVTLLGPGGCGKTRLSIQVAAESLNEFADGVWFVDLATVEDASAIERTVAHALGTPMNPGSNMRQNLLTFLRDRGLLIVLDNCEHLGEEPARFVAEMLKSVPGIRFLATSRRPLSIGGEHTYTVRPLTRPPQNAITRKKVLSSESARLMVDRAWAKASFQITDGNASSVAALCSALEGMPLAIELAASRLKILSPEQLYSRLSKSLDVLKSGSADTDRRHRTLRATVEWSYDLLKAEEQQLLCRLSLLPAGCSLEVAELAAGDLFEDRLDVLDGVEALVNNSLMQVDGEEFPRYRMLETIRQYCAENLTDDIANGVMGRLLPWATTFARRSKAELAGTDQRRALSRAEEEYDNLRACLVWALAHADESNSALQLAAELDRYWYRSGMMSEGLGWLEAVLQKPGGDVSVRAVVASSAGALARQLGDFAKAENLLSQSVTTLRQEEDKRALAGALTNLGMVCAEMGEPDKCRACMMEALGLAKSLGDAALAGLVLQNLGHMEKELGNLEQAMELLSEALPMLRAKHEGAYALAVLLSNIASIQRLRGLHSEAAKSLKESIEISFELHNAQLLAEHVLNLAELSFAEQQFSIAARLLGCSRAAWKISGATPTSSTAKQDAKLAAELREVLHSSELNEALGSGRGMDLGEICDYALLGSDLLSGAMT